MRTVLSMTYQEFLCEGSVLSGKAQVLDTLHAYFLQAAPRIYFLLRKLGLLERPLGDVLEFGPFYGYLPFFLREHASTYTVMEGDDPVIFPLLQLYKESAIDCQLVDFFEIFGPTRTAKHAFEFPDASFDSVICWETMEHFNFNPVKFVREIRRILRPGGKAYITVPNSASFQNIFSLFTGRGEKRRIDSYYEYEDYESNGKKAFFGFHWREYTAGELSRLFAEAGFQIVELGTFSSFQENKTIGPVQEFARTLSRVGTRILQRHGTNVYLIAGK